MVNDEYESGRDTQKNAAFRRQYRRDLQYYRLSAKLYSTHMDVLHALAAAIFRARHIAVLTGAGMSTESGIPDFRSANGLFTKDRTFVDVVSIDYFHADPVGFWQAFHQIFRIKMIGDYQPNPGHEFLARLERLKKRVSILTQNIDGLHRRAGSREVLELHGTLMTATCPLCDAVHDLEYVQTHELPLCRQCTTIIKPDVVLYGEPVPLIEPAFQLTEEADLLLVLGSSLEVGPVNQIPLVAADAGVPCALINLTATPLDSVFDLSLHARIGETCEQLSLLLDEAIDDGIYNDE